MGLQFLKALITIHPGQDLLRTDYIRPLYILTTSYKARFNSYVDRPRFNQGQIQIVYRTRKKSKLVGKKSAKKSMEKK